MINLRNKETGEIEQHYECTPRASIELCFANIECLLHIALADSDDHIRELGGESELLNLMNRYLSLAQCLRDWEMEEYEERSKPNNDGERELLDRAVKALEAEFATKTCNKQIVSKLEDAELVRDSEETCNNKQVISKLVASDDTISRQAAKELYFKDGYIGFNKICELPSAQPEPSEITDEQAIRHLQSTGWMQNHDREMYESGLREKLADDSGSYDSLILCEDAISRQAVLDIINFEDKWLLDAKWHNANTRIAFGGMRSKVSALQPVTPQPKEMKND